VSSPEPSHHVLLVEDSEDDVFFFRRALRKSGVGATLTIARDGLAGLRMLQDPQQRQQFDVVFLDLKLPMFTGFEILEWLRQEGIEPKPLIYVLSGSCEATDREKALELGAIGYLEKPIDVATLRAVLPQHVPA
jgi:CheY-like chemotaxis protein